MEKDRRIGDQAQISQGTTLRKFYGQEVVVPVGGEQVGKSGFTIFEVKTLDGLAQKRRNQLRCTEGPSSRGLFDMD